jgi:hypothetical protein
MLVLLLIFIPFISSLSSRDWLDRIETLSRILLARDLKIAAQLSFEYSMEAAPYWTPYKCSFVSVGCTESSYIDYSHGQYLTEHNNPEKIMTPGKWWTREALYQVQLLFFRTLRDFCPEIGKKILKVPNFEIDEFEQRVNCHNPLPIVSKELYLLIDKSVNCLTNANELESEWNRTNRVIDNAINILRQEPNLNFMGEKLSIYHTIHTINKYNLHFNIITPDWNDHSIQYLEFIPYLLQVGIIISVTSTNNYFLHNQNIFSWCHPINYQLFPFSQQNCVWKVNIGSTSSLNKNEENFNLTQKNELFLSDTSTGFYEKYHPNLILFDQLLSVGKRICLKYKILGISIATNPYPVLDPHCGQGKSENIFFSLRGTNFTDNQSFLSSRKEMIHWNYEKLESLLENIKTQKSISLFSTWLEWLCYPIPRRQEKYPDHILGTSSLRSYRLQKSDLRLSQPLQSFFRTNQQRYIALVSAGSSKNFPKINHILRNLVSRDYSIIYLSSSSSSSSSSFQCNDHWCREIYQINSSEVNQVTLLHQQIHLFFSHCGYNSLMESIEALVPLICFPILWNQPENAKIVEEEDIGIYLRHVHEPDLTIALDLFDRNQKKYRKNMIHVREYVHETTIPISEVTKLFVKVANARVKLSSSSEYPDFGIDDEPNCVLD